MVATATTTTTTSSYRTKTDPDGVIHIDDDADYDEPVQGYGSHAKGNSVKDNTTSSVNGNAVLGEAHIIDPPDERYMQEQGNNRRDPPMDPGAPIISIKSIASSDEIAAAAAAGQPQPMTVEEDARARGLIRRDPSLRSNPSMTAVSIVKSDPSFAKGVVSPTVSFQQQQQRQQRIHEIHEVISVESMDCDNRRNTVSPIVPSHLPFSEKQAARESWVKTNPIIRPSNAAKVTQQVESLNQTVDERQMEAPIEPRTGETRLVATDQEENREKVRENAPGEENSFLTPETSTAVDCNAKNDATVEE